MKLVKEMGVAEVSQMIREAIIEDSEYESWHVSTKHLMTFARMVAARTVREIEKHPQPQLTLHTKESHENND